MSFRTVRFVDNIGLEVFVNPVYVREALRTGTLGSDAGTIVLTKLVYANGDTHIVRGEPEAVITRLEGGR